MILAILAALCLVAPLGNTAPVFGTENKEVIPNEYIVLFKENITNVEVTKHMQILKKWNKNDDTKILYEYDFASFRGYSVRASRTTLEQFIQKDPAIRMIEANQKVHAYRAQCMEQRMAPWGIVRTTTEKLAIEGIYSYKEEAGSGVNVYIIDTGIYLENVDFENRAVFGKDVVDDDPMRDDPNGHGTHVAGTVCSKKYGLAKKAICIAVRVLNSAGSGSTAGVIKGIEWVTEDHSNRSEAKSVANLSLGGGKSITMNEAVKNSVDKGVIMVVAAGNEAQDACKVSPASEPSVISVGCSDNNDEFCSFSNYGTCMNIIAPGKGITSTWNTKNGINTISGTSMSSPHVAGVVAKYLSSIDTTQTMEDIKNWLNNGAVKNMIREVPTKKVTVNSLVHMDCA